MRCPFESTKYGGSHSFRAEDGGAANRSLTDFASAARADRLAFVEVAAGAFDASSSAGARSACVAVPTALTEITGASREGPSDALRGCARRIASPSPAAARPATSTPKSAARRYERTFGLAATIASAAGDSARPAPSAPSVVRCEVAMAVATDTRSLRDSLSISATRAARRESSSPAMSSTHRPTCEALASETLASRSRAISLASAKRADGSRARPRITTASMAGPRSGTTELGGAMAADSTCARSAGSLSAWNNLFPVRASHSTIEAAKTSDLLLTPTFVICSGDM